MDYVICWFSLKIHRCRKFSDPRFLSILTVIFDHVRVYILYILYIIYIIL
jgi:hypothetical protein